MLHLKQILFFACLKAKIEEKVQKKLFKLFLDQKQFWPFLENKKNIKQTLILILFFDIVL